MSPLHLGFACVWNRDGNREQTWSHTPIHLWKAIERRGDVVIHDVPVRMPRIVDLFFRTLSMRFVDGRRWSTWALRPTFSRLNHIALKRSIAKAGAIDAILDMGEQGPIDVPLYVYQDFCFGHGIEMYNHTGHFPHGWSGISLAGFKRRAQLQAQSYASCAGVFTMSQWNADYLVRSGLIEASRVHVVHAGMNVPVDPPTEDLLVRKRSRNIRTLLFVGREFHRKGGDLVVAAFEKAKRLSSRPLRLIVAGPHQWPLHGSIPEGVEFIGEASLGILREHMRNADVMVMPSRFEAFGIVFIEALAAGTPVIGRRAFAMPEFIKHGHNGMLIDHDDPSLLAEVMISVVENEIIARTCNSEANQVASYYSWDRVAADMIDVISSQLHR